tara:strand:- start:562 stop:1341 length:780 start_codon:yes stop_codon:yes gene_type:complete
MKIRITILGCGSSVGVPSLGNNWGKCDPKNPKNRRRRCSILIEVDKFVLLVDTSPDLREQLLDADVQRIDAVLFTHGHADHTHGLDDLRPMFWRMREPINVFGDESTLRLLESRFDYMFKKAPESPPYFQVPLIANRISESEFKLGELIIQPIPQDHGVSGSSLGFLFDSRVAYSTDVAYMKSKDLARLKGIDVWIVDCLRSGKSMAHSHISRTLEWIEVVKPKRSFFTHMTNDLDYDQLVRILPGGVEPAYDGLVIEL